MVNRMHVAVPQARDKVSRPPVIPAGVAQARAARDAGYKPPTEKDLQVDCYPCRVNGNTSPDLSGCRFRQHFIAHLCTCKKSMYKAWFILQLPLQGYMSQV